MRVAHVKKNVKEDRRGWLVHSRPQPSRAPWIAHGRWPQRV